MQGSMDVEARHPHMHVYLQVTQPTGQALCSMHWSLMRRTAPAQDPQISLPGIP